MRIAIVGAGALGRVYGVRLACEAAAKVTFVVRPSRVDETTSLAIERVDGRANHALSIAEPSRAPTVPKETDIVIVCVRAEQLDEPLLTTLANGAAPVVVMTPMLPKEYERMRARLGQRVVAAMPGVISYVNSADITRYWLPRAAPTLLDQPVPVPPALANFKQALVRAGMPTNFAMGVAASNPATTVTFIPLTMALDVAGSIDALLQDKALLDLGLSAAEEGGLLAQTLGPVAPWAGMLTRFLGPTTLKIGVGLARRHSGEAVQYVEDHFGRKLHAQNVAMASAIVELAREKGTPHVALDALSQRLASIA